MHSVAVRLPALLSREKLLTAVAVALHHTPAAAWCARAKFWFGRKNTTVSATMERPEIKSAAHYWRQRLANARTKNSGEAITFDTLARASLENDPSIFETAVRVPLTEQELNRFERAMAFQFACTLIYARDNNWLFEERGMDTGCWVYWAAQSVGLNHNIVYNGYYTRMRILLDNEVAHEKPPYLSQEWTILWSTHSDSTVD